MTTARMPRCEAWGIVVDRVTWRQLDQQTLRWIARVAAGLRPPHAPRGR